MSEQRTLPVGPTIQRRRGCWNCRHWNNQALALSHWKTRRFADLTRAKALSETQPDGEDSGPVKAIRRMVDQTDRAVTQGVFGICLISMCDADFVHNAYLCESWSAQEGASLATSGTAPDKLPEELKADQAAALKDGSE